MVELVLKFVKCVKHLIQSNKWNDLFERLTSNQTSNFIQTLTLQQTQLAEASMFWSSSGGPSLVQRKIVKVPDKPSLLTLCPKIQCKPQNVLVAKETVYSFTPGLKQWVRLLIVIVCAFLWLQYKSFSHGWFRVNHKENTPSADGRVQFMMW